MDVWTLFIGNWTCRLSFVDAMDLLSLSKFERVGFSSNDFLILENEPEEITDVKLEMY